MIELRFTLSEEALADLEAIFDYSLDGFGPQQALAYQDALIASCRQIADQPMLGQVLEGYGAGDVRFLPSRQHIVIYRIQAARILILRFAHGRSDWRS